VLVASESLDKTKEGVPRKCLCTFMHRKPIQVSPHSPVLPRVHPVPLPLTGVTSFTYAVYLQGDQTLNQNT
jgi:hypothetical protein